MTCPWYADFHVHTHLSPCGKPQATAEAMIGRAREKGLAAIGFSDHITPQPVPGCSFYEGQRPYLLTELRAEIAVSPAAPDIEVLVGVEADYTLARQTCLDVELLSLADHIVCGASHFHLAGAPQPVEDTPCAKAALMAGLAREALSVPGMSIWAHPFDCSRMRPLAPILEAMPDDELAVLIGLANAQQIAVEINGGAGLLEEYRRAMARFYGLAREMGARLTITADAHHPNDLDRLDLALAWAHKMGARERDLLTAQELRDRQGRKKRAHQGMDDAGHRRGDCSFDTIP
jgi:histidinol phosphatase-like PHP family hydrolase